LGLLEGLGEAGRGRLGTAESGGCSGAGEAAGQARAGQGASPQANADTRGPAPKNVAPADSAESARGILRRGEGGLAGRLGHVDAVAHFREGGQQARPTNGAAGRLVSQRAGDFAERTPPRERG
jgi:hypothetical protein